MIFKGFESDKTLKEGQAVFSSLSYHPLLTPDDAFDLGAYRDAAHQIDLERLCFFNTSSEIVAENWLAKFSANLGLPYVGMVGATGSMESLRRLSTDFPRFPNVHVRSNAFMLRRDMFLESIQDVPFSTKMDAFFSRAAPPA